MQRFKTILKIAFFLQFLYFNGSILCQNNSVKTVCLSEDEYHLAELINTFRKQNNLAEVPISVSLSFVAKSHVADLQTNRPDTSICNTASWSNKGKWTSCCYNNYVLKFDCMWDKPKELTSYNYRGYELSYYEEGIVQVDSVFKIWKTSQQAIDMLLAQNTHSDKKWLALGVGVSENYVSIWFGQRTDIQGKPQKCKKENSEIFQPTYISDTLKSESTEKKSKYYLIFGSFNNNSDANEAVKRFKNAGLSNVKVLVKDERYRIALDVFNTFKEAKAAQAKYYPTYPEAWIYKE